MNRSTVPKRVVAAALFLILPLEVHALTPDQVFDRVKDSVVVVKSLDARGKMKALGSGVLLPAGQVATNCHVVEGGTAYTVIQGTQMIPATLSARDGGKDICLLDVADFKGRPAQIGSTRNLKVGAKVYAVGAPGGLELSLSDGIISQLRGGPPPLIQTTAAISSGSSGGGLFDDEGRLIGLTTLQMKGGQNLNFAMPVEWISEVKSSRNTGVSGRNQTDWLKRTRAFEKSKDWNGLLEWCGRWIKSEPKNARAWWSLAIAYMGLDRPADAVHALRQALQINPADAGIWVDLGGAYKRLERPDDSLDAYRQALRIDPGVAETWSKLGAVYVRLNRYNEAVDAYRHALRIDPQSADAWGKLGAAYSRLYRYTDAVDACRRSLRIDAKRASIWALLGNSYSRLKRYNDAVDAYREALRIDPAFANAWAGLAVTYNESGDHRAAQKTVEELRRLDPRWAEEVSGTIAPRASF